MILYLPQSVSFPRALSLDQYNLSRYMAMTHALKQLLCNENQADIDHMRDMGWNTIRLGVVWAGAQPRDEDALDSDFLELLHDVLDLTDANEVHVLLDNHGDMVGSAGKSKLSILLIIIQQMVYLFVMSIFSLRLW